MEEAENGWALGQTLEDKKSRSVNETLGDDKNTYIFRDVTQALELVWDRYLDPGWRK
jgi:hypothetical protein